MAANVKRSNWSASPHEVRFVCPRCRREETAIISASGELTPIKRIDAPPRDGRPQAGAGSDDRDSGHDSTVVAVGLTGTVTGSPPAPGPAT